MALIVGLFTEKLADMVLIGSDSTRVVRSENSRLYLFLVSFFFYFYFYFYFYFIFGN